MSIIARYVGLSLKKNFTYRINGVLVILDTLMDCFSIWLFWSSLMELELNLIDWNIHALKLFMGFSLISSSVSNLFVGAWDIEAHILEGTLDTYLVKPCNSVLLILLERANFLRFMVTFPIGSALVIIHAGFSADVLLSFALCVIATVLIELIILIVYEFAFWIKKVDSLADMLQAVCSISQYPLVFFEKKLVLFFTYIIPVAFVGTIPTELIMGKEKTWFFCAFLGIVMFVGLFVNILWKLGRRRYESANT